MHEYHAIREKLRHQLCHAGRTHELKAKDFIGPDQTLLFIRLQDTCSLIEKIKLCLKALAR